jgi:hypothetical protein
MHLDWRSNELPSALKRDGFPAPGEDFTPTGTLRRLNVLERMCYPATMIMSTPLIFWRNAKLPFEKIPDPHGV